MKFRKLKASEIDVRVATISEKGCSLLLYKDARVDQNILDETVGSENWQRSHEVINGNLFCNVGIWIDRRNDGYGEWVWKQDVGVESYTEKEKGQASDAFKRACFNWGIGRELYTAPFIWVRSDKVNLERKDNGKITTNDTFKVTEIDYDDEGTIDKLIIENTKKGMVVYRLNGLKSIYMNNDSDSKTVETGLGPTPVKMATPKQIAYLRNIAKEKGQELDEEAIKTWTSKQASDYIDKWTRQKQNQTED